MINFNYFLQVKAFKWHTGWPVANLEIPESPKPPKYRDKYQYYRGNTGITRATFLLHLWTFFFSLILTMFDIFNNSWQFWQFLTILTILWCFWPIEEKIDNFWPFFDQVYHFLTTFDHFLTKNHDPGNTGVNTGILSIYPGIPVCTPVIPGMLATLSITPRWETCFTPPHPIPPGAGGGPGPWLAGGQGPCQHSSSELCSNRRPSLHTGNHKSQKGYCDKSNRSHKGSTSAAFDWAGSWKLLCSAVVLAWE